MTKHQRPNGAGRRFAEFFAGIGLMRMGLAQQGWSAAFANDISSEKRRMYEDHFGHSEHFHVGDVQQLSADEVPSVDLATASFPCTDLSVAGGRQGLDKGESSAFWGFHQILERMGDRRPKLVLLENVTGFLTSKKGRDFRRAMEALNSLGYAVDPFILDAKWFVPQSRPRLFVVGVLQPSDDDFPNTLIGEIRIRPRAVVDFLLANDDIRWNIRDLPEPPARSQKTLADVLDDLPDDNPHWWSRSRAEYLYHQMSDRHLAVADEMIARDRWTYGTVFRRVRQGRSMAELRTDGLAGCLRTPKGGSGRQILFRAGFGRYDVRLLTASECARLMGADGFRTTVRLNKALFGFGDAVCVSAVSWIAEHYLNPLCGQSYGELLPEDSGDIAAAVS